MAVKKSSSQKSNNRKQSAENGTLAQSNGVEKAVTVQSVSVSDYEIRQRAYELYQARGCQDGYDWDDWIQAETELRSQQKETA